MFKNLFVFLLLLTISANAQIEELMKQRESGQTPTGETELESKLREQQMKQKPAEDFDYETTPPVQRKVVSDSITTFIDRDDTAAAKLKAFGYKFFNLSPTSFEPAKNIPVPNDYKVGPGDQIVITVWGETQIIHNLTISRNGTLYIPNAGLIYVNGLTMKELESKIRNIMSNYYSSLSDRGLPSSGLDVSAGKLRTVKVYILGEIFAPGGYTLPSLSTALTALYYSGGPKVNGSLRNIQVRRNGKVIGKIDLYNYLVSGDKSDDIRLQDDDVIFVPPIQKRIALKGGVFRPAVYELSEDETLKDLINYAGGLTFDAFTNKIYIERVVPFEEREKYEDHILSITKSFSDVSELLSSNMLLEAGDIVNINKVDYRPINKVRITGQVRNPGDYELTDANMTVRDLIIEAGYILPEAFLEKAILVRTLPVGDKEVITFDLKKAITGDPENNYKLFNRDVLTIYNNKGFNPIRNVTIKGSVKQPGKYLRYENMTVSDLIVLAGGLTDTATTLNLEISRLDTTEADVYNRKFVIDMPHNYWDMDPSEDFILADYDRVLVKANPLISFGKSFSISGEIFYPGEYALLSTDEKITDLIDRAGGFLESAYPEGMYIKRKNEYTMQSDTTFIPDSLKTFDYEQKRYYRSLTRNFSNRIPVIWEEIEDEPSSIYNFRLEPGDTLVVPRDPKVVYITGEVGIPSSTPYVEGKDLEYYIRQAGGYTEAADEGADIVILPNGRKWEPSGWFFIPDDEIASGSVIIVPTKLQQESEIWPFIRDGVSVLSSAAVIALTIIQATK